MSWTGLILSGLGAAALGYAAGFAGLAVAMLVNGVGGALFHPVSSAPAMWGWAWGRCWYPWCSSRAGRAALAAGRRRFSRR